MAAIVDLLEPVRVLDLTRELSGSYCTKILVDLGADVVKVEPEPGGGLRNWSATDSDVTRGALFEYLNASKRSVRSGGSYDSIRQLLDGCHLVVEDGYFDDDRLASNAHIGHRHLCVTSISGFGHDGPWRDRPWTEFTLQAMCGSTGSRGPASRPPVYAGGRLGEWIAGAYAAVISLAMVRSALLTGVGDHADVSILECMAISMHGYAGLKASLGATGFPVSGREVEVPSVVASSDGFVNLTTNSRQQFDDLLIMIDRADLLLDTELASREGRQRRQHEFVEILSAWTRDKTVEEILEIAAAFRIPAAAVATPDAILAVDHFRERGVFAASPSRRFLQPRPPYIITGVNSRTSTRSPEWAEHTGTINWDPGSLTLGSSPVPCDGPLGGLRIVDMTAWWAGPSVGQMFAALGADVIKVESVQHPDGQRFSNTSRLPPADGWWESGYLFQAVNVNKRGVTLDLTSETGVALLHDLVAVSDGVVENYSPRVLDNFGINWDSVRARSDAVMMRMPAFGLSGPWRDRVGFAQTMEAASGMAWLTGFRDDLPLLPRGPCDPMAGMHAAAAFIAAVIHREAGGPGCCIETPMIESVLNVAAELVIEWSGAGACLTRDGNRGPVAAPQGVYRCLGADTWVALAVATDDQWERLVDVIGGPLRARCSSSVRDRRVAHDEIDVVLAAWFAIDQATTRSRR